ncbi:M13 family metallopeptidase [Dietzia sp.]|uniref:M13 family metallopeptidase n=1 Tax=Dietzia sp. TaxID=1871616 RepID=UPI002FD9EA36
MSTENSIANPAGEQRRSGLDLAHKSEDVRPQDDFYMHINGGWIDSHTIPADRGQDGAFTALRDSAEEQVRDIITEAPKDSTIGALYASFMDTDTIAERGLAVLDPDLELIDAATDSDALGVALATLERRGVGGLFGSYVSNDAGDSSRYAVYLLQYGIGLPDESYYRAESHREVLAAYRAHVARMLEMVGLAGDADEAKRRADAIVDLESRIASGHWDVVASRDAVKTYNPTAYGQLPEIAPGFPWHAWITELGGSADSFDRVILSQPSFFTSAALLWSGEDLELWKDWARWRVVSERIAVLPEEYVEANFEFVGKIMSGAETIRDRWKRGVALVEGAVGEEVGRAYVERHFPPENKQRMSELVDNILAAYRQSIENLEWMTPETRERALEKLGKFVPKIGYPDKWRDYSALVVAPDDLAGNVRRAAEFQHDYEISKLGGPVDTGEWHMTPQTVNAYYNPVMNEIVFPAAILQPPFFDADADDAMNYGGIGGVIGHEIGHGFDDQGSQYDGDGNLDNWWTDADREEFTAQTTALIEQYDALTPEGLDPETHHVNGAFTIGENIGDLGGLGIAVLAYAISLGGSLDDAPEIDGATGIQRLFQSWAVVWRAKTRDEEAIRRLAIDPHSPPEFRCNQVVRNIDAFYEAFGVTEDDEMWLPEDRRVSIWT